MTVLREMKGLKKLALTKLLMQQEHIREWRESAEARTRSNDFEKHWYVLTSAMRDYIQFLCSNPANGVLEFADLVNEALIHPTAKPAMIKIDFFYKWLQGKDAGDYIPRQKHITENSASQIAYSRIRAFYSRNGVHFPKQFRAPKQSSEPRVAVTDRALKVLIYDEDGLPVIDHDEVFQPFFKRLGFRDQVICACQLGGGGHDLVDLLQLTVGQVREVRNYSRDGQNFLWAGTRQKTGKRFKVPFTSSATKLLKEYVKQERLDATDEELVFLKREDENGRVLVPSAVSMNYKNALYNALNITNGINEYNPMRPKRLRHIFTTIATKRARSLNISPNMIRLWQGHAPNIQDGYVEEDWQSILRDYRKLEPYFQVFQVVKTDTDKLVEDLQAELTDYKEMFNLLAQGVLTGDLSTVRARMEERLSNVEEEE